MATSITKNIGRAINIAALVAAFLIVVGLIFAEYSANAPCRLLTEMRDDPFAVTELQAVLIDFAQRPEIQEIVQKRSSGGEYRTSYGKFELADYSPFDRFDMAHHHIDLIVQWGNDRSSDHGRFEISALGFSYGRADLMFENLLAQGTDKVKLTGQIELTSLPQVNCRANNPDGEDWD